MQHEITPTMSYEVNLSRGELRWVDISVKPAAIYRVLFDKFEVAMNVQFAVAECLFEGNTKRKLRSAIEDQERGSTAMLEEEPFAKSKSGKKLVKIMEEEPIVNTYESSSKKNPKSSRKANQEESAKLIFQAKIADRALICAGDHVEVLKVEDDESVNVLRTQLRPSPLAASWACTARSSRPRRSCCTTTTPRP